ncbi:MAG: hypothetical protein AAF152_21400 [Cyanobacteria bacterium P01_A01_bin.114]
MTELFTDPTKNAVSTPCDQPKLTRIIMMILMATGLACLWVLLWASPASGLS